MRRRVQSFVLSLALIVAVGVVASLGARVLADPMTGEPQHLAMETLTISTHEGARRFHVQVANTDETREKGLMFRRAMPADEGMIFDFFAPQTVSFWMRNTWIGLDIIFIDGEGRVINIAANARPMDETPLSSLGPARAVLELNAGEARRLGIQPGDLVSDDQIFKSRRMN